MISLNVWKTDAHGNTSIGYNDEDESDDEECEGEDAIITVPLTISLIVLFCMTIISNKYYTVISFYTHIDICNVQTTEKLFCFNFSFH